MVIIISMLKLNLQRELQCQIFIDIIISKYEAMEKAKTAVSITPCGQPSPRVNFSLSVLPTGDLLMFGGEFSEEDGSVRDSI